jgi:hypothetical protein
MTPRFDDPATCLCLRIPVAVQIDSGRSPSEGKQLSERSTIHSRLPDRRLLITRLTSCTRALPISGLDRQQSVIFAASGGTPTQKELDPKNNC